MKLLIISLSLFACLASRAQSSQLSEKIAQRMKDSLLLTDEQKQSIYDINVQLHTQKMSVRRQYGTGDSAVIKTQRIENSRDSLYRGVLSPGQYQQYRQKKRRLVNNN